jgi:hypothetical protein
MVNALGISAATRCDDAAAGARQPPLASGWVRVGGPKGSHPKPACRARIRTLWVEARHATDAILLSARAVGLWTGKCDSSDKGRFGVRLIGVLLGGPAG